MNFPTYNPYLFANNQPKQDINTPIPIRNEQEVLNYPVAPGNSVSFKHESEPYIYIKTMGISPFDSPEIVKYERIKEKIGSPDKSSIDSVQSLKEDDLKLIRDDIESVKAEIKQIKSRIEEINSKDVKQLPMVRGN